MSYLPTQQELCRRLKAEFIPSPANFKVGISSSARAGVQPINGLRHPPEGDTTGWYLWGGTELSAADNFFKPLHVQHLIGENSPVLRFLGLPPGWRFLIDNKGYEDIWFDETLLRPSDQPAW
jgi:hypothetical protein